jgi:phytoene synthase
LYSSVSKRQNRFGPAGGAPAHPSDATPAGLSYAAALVRRLDRDRYLTALFAPAARRESLMALYAFNSEVARIREAVSEPMMGLIRLQWWRDAIGESYDGTLRRRHPVLEVLAQTIAAHGLPRAPFDRLLDAREQDVGGEPIERLEALVAYAAGTSGTLMSLALDVLATGASQAQTSVAEAARQLGVAWALVGLLRAVPFHARARRLYLPTDLLEKHGARRSDVLELRSSPALAQVAREVAGVARTHLDAARAVRVPRPLLSPFLLAPLAERYLRQLERVGFALFEPAASATPPGRIWRLLPTRLTGRI